MVSRSATAGPVLLSVPRVTDGGDIRAYPGVVIDLRQSTNASMQPMSSVALRLPREPARRETSPYLLQHKDNPVEWWPWGREALAEAKRADKPILLSVGYAACHWCHVMAHE